ncbi:hypothetical protein [Lactococcus formosensis]|uniref:hypothetical protein n=1 Tax=Lactococcus formosensis TaxID=1281486 RepID=UPI001FAFB3EE|nr:hypothetical protein [Lactococcus formosensis]
MKINTRKRKFTLASVVLLVAVSNMIVSQSAVKAVTTTIENQVSIRSLMVRLLFMHNRLDLQVLPLQEMLSGIMTVHNKLQENLQHLRQQII